MNNNMKRFFIFLICILFQKSYSQNDKEVFEIFEKTNKYYSNSIQHLDFNYKLFASYTSKIITEEYEGFHIKRENSNYTRIHNTEFIQKGLLFIKINHDQKVILIIESKEEGKKNTPLNISNYLKYFKTKSLKDKGTNWLISLETNVLTQLPYSKIEIIINKTNFKIEKQILYFLDNVPYNEKGIKKNGTPKLEITIKEKIMNQDIIEELFKTQKYIIKTQKGYVLSQKYSNYKLLKD